ncbi:MAG: glutamate racemase [Elusimicrobiales bacterium]|nr:glutamate racemase [Elusimicrobiales bacterium]
MWISYKSPIGIFDSGLGGLTVYREVRKILPHEDIIYFGDTLRVPYGNKSVSNIRIFAKQITEFLSSFKVKMIVVACNTVSANALEVVKKSTNAYVIGMIEPGVRAALNITSSKRIIVIGTRATINSHAYSKFIKRINPSIIVKEIACPLFVPLVEEGFINDKISIMVSEKYLGRFRNSKFDTLILGCTHYPLLKDSIKKVLPSIEIVDSSVSSAYMVKDILEKNNIINKSSKIGYSKFFVSDRPQNFIELSYRLAGVKICKINIKRF